MREAASQGANIILLQELFGTCSSVALCNAPCRCDMPGTCTWECTNWMCMLPQRRRTSARNRFQNTSNWQRRSRATLSLRGAAKYGQRGA